MRLSLGDERGEWRSDRVQDAREGEMRREGDVGYLLYLFLTGILPGE